MNSFDCDHTESVDVTAYEHGLVAQWCTWCGAFREIDSGDDDVDDNVWVFPNRDLEG